MKRRRFLQIVAATVGAGSQGQAGQKWSGKGFGADLYLNLVGDGDGETVLSELPLLIRKIEAEFSLFDPGSSLSRLNRDGRLAAGSMFLDLIDKVAAIHDLTDGVFDPTIQGIWDQRIGLRANPIVGWHHLVRTGTDLALPPECALTLNGIAQGYAADLVRKLLAENGFTDALIDMGEHFAMGGPWKIGVSDPSYGLLASSHLANSAISTSSPFGTLVVGTPHLIHPSGNPPLWSTVSVEASDAAYADGISTAAVFFPINDLQDLMTRCDMIHRITLVDFNGDLQTLTG